MNNSDIQRFISDGFLKIEHAFPRELAETGRELLWRETKCNPHDPASWMRPVIRLGDYGQEPFRQIANMPLLHSAFDKLVGAGRWLARSSLGTFPIRFPSTEMPDDDGWHTEASFKGNDGSLRLNVTSRGRALLMLFLFSDVGEHDAPTRIRVGSHLDVPSLLNPFGDAGLSFEELAQKLDVTANRHVALATGVSGTVYLCHPFIVHAAQRHCGTAPRFMAQPPLYSAEPLRLERDDCSFSPVEVAIRKGLGLHA
jgi:hypothetical protein